MLIDMYGQGILLKEIILASTSSQVNKKHTSINLYPKISNKEYNRSTSKRRKDKSSSTNLSEINMII